MGSWLLLFVMYGDAHADGDENADANANEDKNENAVAYAVDRACAGQKCPLATGMGLNVLVMDKNVC